MRLHSKSWCRILKINCMSVFVLLLLLFEQGGQTNARNVFFLLLLYNRGGVDLKVWSALSTQINEIRKSYVFSPDCFSNMTPSVTQVPNSSVFLPLQCAHHYFTQAVQVASLARKVSGILRATDRDVRSFQLGTRGGAMLAQRGARLRAKGAGSSGLSEPAKKRFLISPQAKHCQQDLTSQNNFPITF